MYNGDRARKTSLVDYGFRLPSALDNRPLYYAEIEELLASVVYVSATPGEEELEKSDKAVVEQIIRPTGLLDPEVTVCEAQRGSDRGPLRGDRETHRGRRADPRHHAHEEDGRGPHELPSGAWVSRSATSIPRSRPSSGWKSSPNLRFGKLRSRAVGINLLREGLDLPEVSLIAILDADKIGFLRSATSLIQTIGRAARNVNGKVIMYADRMSDAMKLAISETERRRARQQKYNAEHGITPKTIKKAVLDILERKSEEKKSVERVTIDVLEKGFNLLIPKERAALIKALEAQMLEHAKNLEFEEAALVRDEIARIKGMG
jgi:excinuclease ABC subunit B